MGQRLHPMVLIIPEDDRGWLLNLTSLKDVSGQPDLPSDQSGFRKERLGLIISRHLNTLAEYIIVNVGGPYMEGAVPDETYGRWSRHSTRSAGKPCTGGRTPGD